MEAFGWPESMPSVGRKAIEELVKGRETANKLRSLLVANDGSHFRGDSLPAEQLVTQILSSFANTLSILNTRPITGGPSDDYSDEVSNFPASRKSEDSGETSKYTDHQPPALQSRRGSYKRRKFSHTLTKETVTLVDDGYGWRKYGQKVILNTKYPRSYFRCTHKYDQGCQATKQVQMLDMEPTVYRTTYAGLHTCTSPLKDSELLLDHTDSSELISFAAASNPHPFFGVKQEQLHASAASTTSTDDVAAGAHARSQSSHDNFYLPADDDTFDHVGGDVISPSCTTSVHDRFDCFDHHQMIGDLDEDDFRLFQLSSDGIISYSATH